MNQKDRKHYPFFKEVPVLIQRFLVGFVQFVQPPPLEDYISTKSC